MEKDPDFDTAEQVANYLLEATGRGLIDNDVEGFVARFNLPLVIGTFDGQQTLETPQELRDTLARVRDYVSQNNIDLIVRHNISAQFVAPDKVSTTHESRYLSKGQQVGQPMICHGTLQKIDGFWKIIDNEYAVQNNPLLDRALLGIPDSASGGADPSTPDKPRLWVSQHDLTQGNKA